MGKKAIEKSHKFLLVFITMAFIWSAIKPAGYLTWTLEVIPAVLGIFFLLFSYRRFQFTTLSYAIIAVLLVLVFIGGHYSYAEVPLFEWLKEIFHLKRNNYDRFGHFAKGFLAIPVREVMIRCALLQPSKWLIFVVLSIILALAAGYEILEWIVAVIMGYSAKAFLGTQGDVWDSDWDMALAFCGSIVCLVSLSKFHNLLLRKK